MRWPRCRSMRRSTNRSGGGYSRFPTCIPQRSSTSPRARAGASDLATEPGGADVGRRMREAGVCVKLVSGGLRPALRLLAEHLGVPGEDLHAVDVRFDDIGSYAGYDTSSPLTTTAGKRG